MSDIFSPGDRAPFSGLYVAIHHNKHIEEHLVTVLRGDRFPLCLGCSDRIRFELSVSAVYIHGHSLFKCDA